MSCCEMDRDIVPLAEHWEVNMQTRKRQQKHSPKANAKARGGGTSANRAN